MTTNIDRAAEIIDQAMGEVAMGYPSKPSEIAEALDAEGRLMPDLPKPDDLLDAVSLDGTIGVMAIWGHNVDVEAMRNPRLRGQGAITVFGRQVRDPRELAYQILAAVNYIEKETV